MYKAVGGGGRGRGVSGCIYRILHSQLQVSVHCPVLYHYMFGVVYGIENQTSTVNRTFSSALQYHKKKMFANNENV